MYIFSTQVGLSSPTNAVTEHFILILGNFGRQWDVASAPPSEKTSVRFSVQTHETATSVTSISQQIKSYAYSLCCQCTRPEDFLHEANYEESTSYRLHAVPVFGHSKHYGRRHHQQMMQRPRDGIT